MSVKRVVSRTMPGCIIVCTFSVYVVQGDSIIYYHHHCIARRREPWDDTTDGNLSHTCRHEGGGYTWGGGHMTDTCSCDTTDGNLFVVSSMSSLGSNAMSSSSSLHWPQKAELEHVPMLSDDNMLAAIWWCQMCHTATCMCHVSSSTAIWWCQMCSKIGNCQCSKYVTNFARWRPGSSEWQALTLC